MGLEVGPIVDETLEGKGGRGVLGDGDTAQPLLRYGGRSDGCHVVGPSRLQCSAYAVGIDTLSGVDRVATANHSVGEGRPPDGFQNRRRGVLGASNVDIERGEGAGGGRYEFVRGQTSPATAVDGDQAEAFGLAFLAEVDALAASTIHDGWMPPGIEILVAMDVAQCNVIEGRVEGPL